MAQPKIKAITVGDRTRYRFVVDIGDDPTTGKRRQLTRTYDGKREAERELSKILTEVNGGQFVAPTKLTLAEHLDAWLEAETCGNEDATKANYRHALKPARDRLGAKPLQKLTKADVVGLRDWMLTSGRRRGGKPGTPLSVRTVRLTLSRLTAALEDAVEQRLITTNVAAGVRIKKGRQGENVGAPARKPKPWTQPEVKQFLGHLAGQRLQAPMLLALMGMGPAELCGVKWDDHVDLDADPPTINAGENTRTIVWEEGGGRVVEKGGKTENRDRVLPLPQPAAAALRRFKALQAKERLAAGEGYEASGYVLVDELGQPVRTDWLRRRAYELMAAAGVRQVRLYDARHACLTFLRMSGVPGPIVSAWAGHGDLTIADRVYVHPSEEDLRQASDVLGRLLGS